MNQIKNNPSRSLLFCSMLLMFFSFSSAYSQTNQEKASAWLLKEKDEAVKNIEESKAKLSAAQKGLDQAKAAKALAIERNDNKALPIAEEAVELGQNNVKEANTLIEYSEKILKNFESILKQTLPKDEQFAIPWNTKGTVQKFVGDKWVPIETSGPIKVGEMVKVGPGSSAEIHFQDGSRINLGPNGNFTLEEQTEFKSIIKLIKGKFYFIHIPTAIAGVLGMVKSIKTPAMVTSVRGTEFDMEVDENNITHFTPYSGKVELTADSANMLKLKIDRWWDNAPATKTNNILPADKLIQITNVQGEVMIVSKDKQSHTAAHGEYITKGNQIITGNKSIVKVLLPGGGYGVLSDSAKFEIGSQDSTGRVMFVIWQGKFHYDGTSEIKTDTRQPRFFTTNAVATGKNSEFVVAVNKKNGVADFIVLKKMIAINAKEELLDKSKINQWWNNY